MVPLKATLFLAVQGLDDFIKALSTRPLSDRGYEDTHGNVAAVERVVCFGNDPSQWRQLW